MRGYIKWKEIKICSNPKVRFKKIEKGDCDIPSQRMLFGRVFDPTVATEFGMSYHIVLVGAQE